jgi:hypothetical protein
LFSILSDKKLHLNSLPNRPKRKKQPPARFCDPEQIAKKSKVEASFIHFSKEHHRSKQHDSKSDQKSIESINQPNRKSTNKLQDVKSIICTNENVLRTNEHSKHSDQAESNMEYSDEGDENITFIPPKPKKAKLNKVVNPMDPNEVLNPGALVDRGTPNEGVGNPETISSGMHQF